MNIRESMLVMSESRARDVYREVELISDEEKIWSVHLFFLTMAISVPSNVTCTFLCRLRCNGHNRKTLMTPVA